MSEEKRAHNELSGTFRFQGTLTEILLYSTHSNSEHLHRAQAHRNSAMKEPIKIGCISTAGQTGAGKESLGQSYKPTA
eukprot:1142468-Pelagomonas_calceolata.AAC.3